MRGHPAQGADRRRARDAARQCRLRARQREGRIRLSIIVNEHDLAEALIAAERLGEGEALDRRLVEQAVESLISDFVARWCRSATD
jgi:hypothetical protein